MKARTGHYRIYGAIWSVVSCNPIPDLIRIMFLTLLLSVSGVELGFADGSRDLYPAGARGKRAYLFSRVNTVSGYRGSEFVLNQSWPFRTYGEHFVYVKSGEVIALASSAQGVGDPGAEPEELKNGVIRLTSPSGVVRSFAYNGSGRISNRTAELAGPRSPGQEAGGNRYLPHYHTAEEAGIWKVEFFPVYELSSTGSYIPLDYTAYDYDANANWVQPHEYTAGQFGRGHDIAAWDVSVWGDKTWKTGRVYTTVMNLSIAGEFSAQSSDHPNGTGFYGKIYSLTKDGWVYEVNNNGQVGVYFTFFVNNKGFHKSQNDKMPRYKSVNFSDTAQLQSLVHDPRTPDVGTEITCKMFYTHPDTDMPIKANVYIAGQTHETWLMTAPATPTIENLRLTGVEGTEGHASQKGGYIRFDASVDGIVRISFALEGYTERTIETVAKKGFNAIFWDGKDGSGNYLPEGTVPAEVSVRLFGAEVHFPYVDVEINPNGTLIRRLQDDGPDADKVYWDDSDISGGRSDTRSSPLKNTDGMSSASNGHKWGRNSTDAGGNSETINTGDGQHSFGNGRSMDTWTYIPSNTVTEEVDLEVLAVDLGVQNLMKDLAGTLTTVRPGDTWNYTVEVFNAPGSSDATGAEFALYLPPSIHISNIADVAFSTMEGSGSEMLASRGFDSATGKFHTHMNLSTGARVRFTIPVVVSPQAIPGSDVDVWATILRPADVYDHDATNLAPGVTGNVIPPTDPFFECQGPDPNPNVSNPYDRNTGDNIPCNNLAIDKGPSIAAFPVVNLTKTVSTSTSITKVGDVINYLFAVSNPGNVDLMSVNLTDSLPGMSAIIGPTYVTGNSDATLNPGEVWQYTATYTVQAADVTTGSVANSATVAAIPSTGGSVTNTASVLTTIYNADLRVLKTASNTAPRVGSIVTFEIEITNTGPSDATNVRVSDVVPNGYTNFAGISDSGSVSGNTISWILAIENGETQTVTYQAKVLASGAGISHVNSVTVTDDNLFDPDTNNNTDEVSVQPRRALSIGNSMIRSRLKSSSN